MSIVQNKTKINFNFCCLNNSLLLFRKICSETSWPFIFVCLKKINMLQISSIASNTGPLIFSWQNENKLHCNPLQGNYRVELLHREIPVVITGNEFTKYNVLLFWLHFFPCFINIEIVVLVPEMCTGNCQFILQGLKGFFNPL